MASRVNTKFIWMLSIAVVVIFGAVAAAVLVFGKASPAQLIARGDKLMAEGKVRDASRQYSKAVNKEQTNVAYLDKWLDSLSKLAEPAKLTYGEDYKAYMNAMRARAIVAKEDIAGQARYLDVVLAAVRASGQRAGFENLLTQTDQFLGYHEKNPPAQLRRYRIAAFAGMLAFSELKPLQNDVMMKDFEAVMAANPGDGEVASWLESVYQIQADRLRGTARSDDMKALQEKAVQVVVDFSAKNPDNPLGILAKLRRDLGEVQKDTLATLSREELVKRSTEFRDKAIPQLDKAAAGVKLLGRPMLDNGALGRLRQMEEILDPGARLRRCLEAVDAALASTPGDAELMLQRADLLQSRDDYAGAIDELTKIMELPVRPVSIAGMRQFDIKDNASYLRALWAVRAWQVIPDTDPNKEIRVKALAQAREYRKSFAAEVPPDSPLLAMVDAQLAYVDKDYSRANQLLAQYNRVAKSRDPESLWLQAQVSLMSNNMGEARQSLRDLLTIKPNAFNAVLLLSDVEMRLQNYAEAESLLRQIANLDPSNESVKKRLAQVVAIQRGDVSTDGLDEPTKALAELDALSKRLKDQPNGAKQMVAAIAPKVEQFKWDDRFAFALCQWQIRADERDAALATLKKGLQAKPDSALLKTLSMALNAKTPLDAELAMIDTGDASDLEKALRRADIYIRFGKPELATEQFEAAAKIAPEDPRVIEQSFMTALQKNDFDGAKKLQDKAIQLDLDHVAGVTFQARYLSAQGKLPEAIALMKQLTDKGGAQPEAWRLLGRMQGAAGNLREAVKAYRESLNIRPQDSSAIIDLVTTLIKLRQNDEALATARQYQKYAGGDVEFTHLYLQLEAEFGDRAQAITSRENFARMMPGDRRNLLSLGDLYVRSGYPDKAQAMVARLNESPDFETVNLDAKVRWALNDQKGARAAFENWIKGHDEINYYLAYAGFLFSKKDIEGSLAILESARSKQDPKLATIDKALVELMAQMERWGDVVAPARRVIEAKADNTDNVVQKRLVEALIRSNALDDADKELKALAAKTPNDLTVLLLEADLAGVRRDVKAQRAALDRAVSKFPQEPLVFVKRGEFLTQDAKTVKEAIADFDQALKIKPDTFEALRGRASANTILGNQDKAIADIQQALKIVPDDTQLLLAFVGDLVGMKLETKAVEVAEEALKARPRDVDTRVRIGDIILQRGGARSTASTFFKSAYDIDKQEGPAQRYLDTLLDDVPVRIAEAERMMTDLGTRVKTSPGFTMALAKLKSAQNKKSEAAEAIIQTFNMLDPNNPGPILAWMGDLQRMTPKKDELDRFLSTAATRVKSPDWMQFFRANVAFDNPGIKDKGPSFTTLVQLSERNVNPALQALAFKSLARAYYNDSKFDGAAKTWAASLKQFPDDIETMNNLAYCLAKDMKKADEALPLAERASQLAPNSGEIADTLGFVYMELGKFDKAAAAYAKALARATTADSAVQFGLLVAEASFKAGDAATAKELIQQTEAILARAQAGEISDQRKTDFERVKALIPTK